MGLILVSEMIHKQIFNDNNLIGCKVIAYYNKDYYRDLSQLEINSYSQCYCKECSCYKKQTCTAIMFQLTNEVI